MEDHETGAGAGAGAGESFLGGGALPRDLANRFNASPVNTGRVRCGGLVIPPTPDGEE